MASYQLTRGSKSAPDTDVLSDALIAVLEGHNAALKANVERLEAHNAALKADVKNLKAMLAAERERADRAIRAFDSQAKLEAMTEANATLVPHRPPWRRRSPNDAKAGVKTKRPVLRVATALFAAILFFAAAFATVVLLDMAPLWPSSRIAQVLNVVIADAVSARQIAARIGLPSE